ncbi:MAG: sigma-70 family RNA polymerase sigma factor [Myxococcota bacterium]
MEVTDRELLVRIAESRDRSAFEQLFQRFGSRLLAFFRRRGCSEQLAQDLLQDVMVKIWSRASQYDPQRASGSAWIYTIARNQLVDGFRRTQRAEPDPEDPVFVRDERGLEGQLDLIRDTERLHRALIELPKEQAEVIRRSYFEGQSLSEIADELRAPLGTVKTRARLAVNALRKRLKGETMT